MNMVAGLRALSSKPQDTFAPPGTMASGGWLRPTDICSSRSALNAVSVSEGDTVVERREQMFRWLPAPGDPLAAHYGVSNHDTHR